MTTPSTKVPTARELAEPITRDLRAWYRSTGGIGPWFELTERIAAAIEADRASRETTLRSAVEAELAEAVRYIGTARELLGEWQSEAWNKHVSEATSEFFATTDIAYGCEHVGCDEPFGHKHVSGTGEKR
jgi:hypothetical protein